MTTPPVYGQSFSFVIQNFGGFEVLVGY